MLDDRIKARILDDHKKLTADGKLLSKAQLEACYQTFRSRFGPDVLAKLDGEELLETMHAHGNRDRDSLVYWLEFKNDDEFPARFGSISGRAIKPIGLRVVAELRDAGIKLPIIATAGIRDFDDCREFFWAGADAVSLGSAVWLTRMPLYALGPLEGLRIRRLMRQVAGYRAPAAIEAAWTEHRPVGGLGVGDAIDTDNDQVGEPEPVLV